MTKHKIFVSIVSYRDPLLDTTIESLLDNQSNNNTLVISVLDQSTNDCKFKDHPNVIYKQIAPQYSNGVGWARHVNSLNLTDEDFFYQIDSHSLFDKNWDDYLIADYLYSRSYFNTNKIAMSSACKGFIIDESNNVCKLDEDDNCYIKVKFIKEVGFNQFKLLNAHGIRYPAAPNSIIDAFHLNAGNFFTHSDFIFNVGICPNMYFGGEEQHLTLSSFINGYKLVHHTSVHLYHLCNTENYITKIEVNPVISIEQQDLLRNNSITYWLNYLDTIPHHVLLDFYKFSGVDYINLKIDESSLTLFNL